MELGFVNMIVGREVINQLEKSEAKYLGFFIYGKILAMIVTIRNNIMLYRQNI